MAEREALAYGERTGMDVVTVCPPWVLGPLLQPTVNATSMRFVAYLKGQFLDLRTFVCILLNIYIYSRPVEHIGH